LWLWEAGGTIGQRRPMQFQKTGCSMTGWNKRKTTPQLEQVKKGGAKVKHSCENIGKQNS